MGIFKPLKQEILKRFPNFDAGYRVYRQHREMHRQRIATTNYGFLFGGHQAMQNGTFEPEEVVLVRRCLEGALVFVDLGANIGIFTCIARQLGKHVIAIEPCIQNLEFLYRNLNANGWDDVEIFPVGLGEKPGLNTLYGWGTGASMVRQWAGCSDSQQKSVPISTLDILLGGRFCGEKLVIKVDVEGLEYSLLQGAEKTLKRSPPPVWLVEVCLTENHPGDVNRRFKDVFHVFWEHGYLAKTVDEHPRVITPHDVERWVNRRKRDFGSVNYLFEKPYPVTP